MSPPRSWKTSLRVYSLATLLGLVVLVLAFRLWEADLTVPFNYSNGGDVHFHLMLFKTIGETGWFLVNPQLGAPGVMDLHDFPYIETGMALLVKGMTAFTDDPFLIANLYVLATFLFVLWASLYALRQLGASEAVALTASLLFAFAPYHLWRGATHPHLSSYFSVPLAVLVALWLCQGEPLLVERSRGGPWRAGPRGRVVAALVTAALIALGGPYYGLFGTYLLATGGLIGWLRRPTRARALNAALLVGLIVACFAAQLVPFWLYWQRHGANPVASFRPVNAVLLLGLRFRYLLRPVAGHRLSWLVDPNLEKLQARVGNVLHLYDETYNEASLTAPLGLVAGLGFLTLLVVVLAWPIRAFRGVPWLKDLAALNLAALFLAQSGGLGELIALNLTTKIRAYNRMSIVIAFLALAGLAMLATRWRARRPSGRWFPFVLGLVLVLGLLDQVPPAALPDYRRDAAQFRSDREFVGRIEAAVPPGSMIFQLPPNSFPEFGIHIEMPDYSLFRGYLHSSHLQWSYGALRGREVERWQSRLAPLPVPELVDELRAANFAGLYVNRRGHARRAEVLEQELTRALGGPLFVSRDGQLSFFRLAP